MNLHLGDELTSIISAWQPTSLLVFDADGVIRCSFGLSGQHSPVVMVPWVVFVTSRPRSCRSLWASFSNPTSFCSLETCSFSSGGRVLFCGPFSRLRGDATTVWVESREGPHVMLLKIGGDMFAFCTWLLLSDCWAVISSEPDFSQGHTLFITLYNTGPDFLLWL